MRRFDHRDMHIVLRELRFYIFNPIVWEDTYGHEDDHQRFGGFIDYLELLGFSFGVPDDIYDFYEGWELPIQVRVSPEFLIEFLNKGGY